MVGRLTISKRKNARESKIIKTIYFRKRPSATPIRPFLRKKKQFFVTVNFTAFSELVHFTASDYFQFSSVLLLESLFVLFLQSQILSLKTMHPEPITIELQPELRKPPGSFFHIRVSDFFDTG